MAHLSIKYINISGGVNPFYFGCQASDEWTQKCADQRASIIIPFNQANSLTATNNLLYGLRMFPTGYVIDIINIIKDVNRAGDSQSVFIHVPYEAEIAVPDLGKVIEDVKKILTSDLGVGIRDVFDSIVTKDYPTRTVPLILPEYTDPTADAAISLSGTLSVGDFIGDGVFNVDFWKYANILLVDRNVWTNIPGTFHPIAATPGALCQVNLKPAKAAHYTIIHGNQPVADVVMVPKGMTITLTYKQPEYKPITKSHKIDKNETFLGPDKSELRIEYSIMEDKIEVVDAYHQPIKKAEITINGTQAQKGQWNLDRDDFTLRVEANGYESITQQCTRQELQKMGHIRLTLKKHIFKYRFAVHTDNGQVAFELSSQNPITESPLPGYECDYDISTGRANYLKPSKTKPSFKDKWLLPIITLVIGLLLGAGIFWLCSSPSGDDKPAEGSNVGGTTLVDTPSPSAQSLTQYLDSTDVWDYKRLEKEDKELLTNIINGDASKVETANKKYNSKNLGILIEQIKADNDNFYKTHIIENEAIYVIGKEAHEIVEYIDKTDQWKKSEMDSLVPGLYDAINTVNYDKVLNEYAKKYTTSKRIKQLTDWINAAKNKWGNQIVNPISKTKTASSVISGDGSLTFATTVTTYYSDVEKWHVQTTTNNNTSTASDDKSKANNDKSKTKDDKSKGNDDKSKCNDDKSKGNDDKSKAEDDKSKAKDDKSKGNDDKSKGNDDKSKGNDDKTKGANPEPTDQASSDPNHI